MNFSTINQQHQKNSLKMFNKKYIIVILVLSISFTFAQTSAGKYQIKNLDINTEYSDFGTAYFGDSAVVFSSPRGKTIIKNIWKPNEQPYLDLYTGFIGSDGSILNKKKMKGGLNSKFHEAKVIFTKDLKTVYFTRNNYENKEVKNDSLGILKLQLFKANVGEKGEWINIVRLPFNSDQYSTGHPALSSDEKKLYFVSDRPESIGKTDIYVTTINEDGTYGTPENLGSTINTIEKEMFPFIGEDGLLYFSSEGHASTGGLDVFASKHYTTTYSQPLKLGAEINSSQDDFAYVMDAKNKMGYFSSNRDGGKGDDDIYSITVEEPLTIDCKQTIAGTVKDINTKDNLEEVKVTLLDKDGVELESMTSSDGAFSFEVDCGSSYSIKANKEDFLDDNESVTTIYDIVNDPNNIQLDLTPYVTTASLQRKLKLIPVYYEYDKWDVSLEADKVVKIMEENPKIIIESFSHTDARASDGYNVILSKKRSKAIVKYIISKGIDKSRISGKWLGESQLINKCADDVECTEDEHAQNRRTEFFIVDKEKEE